MLCHPILDQPAFCAAGSSPAVLNTKQQLKPATPSFYTSSPYNTQHTSNTPSSSSLYSIPLPQQPHMQQLDSFSTPSSATPSSLPAVRSWQQQPVPSGSSVGSNNLSATTTPKQPLILDSLAASKAMMVENLVGKRSFCLYLLYVAHVCLCLGLGNLYFSPFLICGLVELCQCRHGCVDYRIDLA